MLQVGVQGCGVRMPLFAAVAAATVGLLREVHKPKGGMLVFGMQRQFVVVPSPGCQLELLTQDHKLI